VAELGGTGRVHDWSVSAEIVRRAPVPTFLAGGLKPGNVAQAVAAVRPAGVDLCSGIRGADDGLMQDRLESFMEAVGRA
jgi:phosphoribosylanthranilate isomerase